MVAFNINGFYEALNAHRRSLMLSWKSVANKTGVSASTLTRMGHGRSPDINGLAALASWSGIDVRRFFTAPIGKPSKLSEIISILEGDGSITHDGRAFMVKIMGILYEEYRIESDGS